MQIHFILTLSAGGKGDTDRRRVCATVNGLMMANASAICRALKPPLARQPDASTRSFDLQLQLIDGANNTAYRI